MQDVYAVCTSEKKGNKIGAQNGACRVAYKRYDPNSLAFAVNAHENPPSGVWNTGTSYPHAEKTVPGKAPGTGWLLFNTTAGRYIHPTCFECSPGVLKS